jgi:hypothetical protein
MAPKGDAGHKPKVRPVTLGPKHANAVQYADFLVGGEGFEPPTSRV